MATKRNFKGNMKQELSFSEKCYNLLKKVPKGRVTTYKEIAHALGTKAYRAVGTAMNKNPYAPNVACHRVVNSNGYVGGFFSGVKSKIKLLKSEGILLKDNQIQDFEKRLYKF